MKKVKLKAISEMEALAELQRIIDNSNLKEYQLERLWDEALEKTISFNGIKPENPYYYNYVLQKFKEMLINKIGDTMGYGLKRLLEVGYDTLPYI